MRAWIPVVGTGKETGGMLMGPLGAACPLEDGCPDWAEVDPGTGRGVPPGPSHGTVSVAFERYAADPPNARCVPALLSSVSWQ